MEKQTFLQWQQPITTNNINDQERKIVNYLTVMITLPFSTFVTMQR